MGQQILHADINGFYAAVEALHRPELRNRPMAVGGDVETRHGIILAKNPLAKAGGVKTAMAIWEAEQACPGLVVVPPNYPLYIHYSQLAREIYNEYTPYVEPFGLDECWLDATDCGCRGDILADELRSRIRRELGVTISVGVSWNKVFAKLGSDIRKPDFTTVISHDNYRERVWPLDVGDLLYVGPRTARKLYRLGVLTIGQLAAMDPAWLQRLFGKVGLLLGRFARGEDESPVMEAAAGQDYIKSIGNSVTCPRDLVCDEDAKLVFYSLGESVAARLRDHGLVCKVVEISVRGSDLNSFVRQCQLARETQLTQEIIDAAVQLFDGTYDWELPLRGLGLRAASLAPARPEQLAFFPGEQQRVRQWELDHTIDDLRRRYGYHAVGRAFYLTDDMGRLDARGNHVVAPLSLLKAGERIAP